MEYGRDAAVLRLCVGRARPRGRAAARARAWHDGYGAWAVDRPVPGRESAGGPAATVDIDGDDDDDGVATRHHAHGGGSSSAMLALLS